MALICYFCAPENGMGMETILIKAFSFVLIIFGAALLRKAGFFKAGDFSLLSDIVLKITLPCAVISNFSRTSVELSLFYLVPLGVLCNLVTIGLGYLSSPHDRQRRAFNMINLSGYNIGCFTMPYIQSFLGPSGAIATCLFDAGNSLMCTGATYPMAAAVAGVGEKSGVRVFLRRMFSSVPMDTYIIMVVLSLLDVRLPHIVTSFTDIVGSANSFLAMAMIGIGFEVHLERSKLLHIGGILLCRYAVALVMGAAFWCLAPFSDEIRKILLVISFAPMSAVCAIFTSRCSGDVAMSCTVNSLSIIISIVFMTLIMVVF